MKKILISVLLLFMTGTFYGALSQRVSLRFICEAPHLLSSRGSVQLNGSLFFLDSYCQLHKVNLVTGQQTTLGKELFRYKRWFFAVNSQLFIINGDGSMINIDTATGSCRNVLPVMSWRNVSQVVPVGKKFFTVINNTLHFHPTIHPKPSQSVGKPSFYSVKYLLLTDSSLHTVIGNSLYRIDLQNGNWTLVKRDGELNNYRTGAVVRNRFYYIQHSGSLVEINMRNGETITLDDKLFIHPVLFFQDQGKLYYFDISSRLYEVVVEPQPKKGF